MKHHRWLQTWTSLTGCVLVLILLSACGDTTKREAGKNLRQATAEARQLHAKATGLLINPEVDGETVVRFSEPEQALRLLDEAEAILKTALAENYEKIREGGGEKSPVSKTDAALAYYTRGLIHELAADYFAWKAEADIQSARDAVERASMHLMQIQSANARALQVEAVVSGNNDAVRAMQTQAQQEKATAETAVADAEKRIAQARTRIGELEDQIEKDSFEAATLRAESEQMQSAEGREKLKEAWTHQERIHNANQEIQSLEMKVGFIQTELTIAQQMLQAANTKLSDLSEVTASTEDRREKARSELQSVKSQVSTLTRQLQEALASAGQSGTTARALVGQADGRLQLAGGYLAQAMKLAPDSQQAQIASAQADVQASLAGNQMTLYFLRQQVESLVGRVDATWEALFAGKPAQPRSPEVSQFLDSTEQALDVMLSSYEQAVDQQKKAVQNAGRDQRWAFQGRMAALYVNYADALGLAGRDSDAVGMLRSAQDVLGKAIQAAPGKRGETMGELQARIETRLASE